MKHFKHFACFVLLFSVFVLVQSCCKTEEMKPPVKDGLFLHISYGPEDAHRVLMALKMADLMSDSKDVLLYFDITGVEVVFKDAPNLEYSHFPSSHTAIKMLLDKGITIYACPGCIKAAGRTPQDLMPGIQVADKEGFFNFTEGRILTIDY